MSNKVILIILNEITLHEEDNICLRNWTTEERKSTLQHRSHFCVHPHNCHWIILDIKHSLLKSHCPTQSVTEIYIKKKKESKM